MVLQGSANGELGTGQLMLAGGVAGAVYWLTVYPADIIKSKLQVDSVQRPAYKGTLDCARQVCPHPSAALLQLPFGTQVGSLSRYAQHQSRVGDNILHCVLACNDSGN